MAGPDTELNVVITDANGVTKTFDSNAADPADRPRSIQFGTQLQSGFYDGGFELRRAIDRDNDDLHKLDDVKFIGTNAETAYEGYIGAMPRTMDDRSHSLAITTAGWMAHAGDEPFTEILVDRDLSQWTRPSQGRQVSLVNGAIKAFDPTNRISESGAASVTETFSDAWGAGGARSEAWYDAGAGPTVASIYYAWAKSGGAFGTLPGSWLLQVFSSSDDLATVVEGSANLLAAAGPGSGYFTPTTARRHVILLFAFTAVGGTAGTSFQIDWTSVAIYGAHGLPLIGSTDPKGVAASDVITYLANRYAPMLDTSDVKQTTYPISHLVFREATKAYDAFLKVNSYHLWKLGVWEKRKLCYSPIDLTDWDWEIRHDEIGNTIGLQGDSIEDLRNGIKVQYTDAATGAVQLLTPDAFPADLLDTSVDNPANSHGRRMYGDPFVIPWPTTQADALQLGRTKLALDSLPKAPGSFTAQHYLKDRAGVLQPAWKVRAGDRIRLTSSASLSDRPRLIHETRYDHDSRTVTISVDATMQLLDAIIDRQQTARQAAGLS